LALPARSALLCLLSLVPVSIPLISSPLQAQTGNTITLRMMDAKTGKMISTTDFLVQINHQQSVHADWVQLNDDGSGKLTLPPDASLILIHGKYDNSMSIYVNCDSVRKGKIPTMDSQVGDHWYPVADILKSGIVTHNGCGKDSTSFAPKPGEFVFFVRKLNWRESDM
jgi:hypothetical protein